MAKLTKGFIENSAFKDNTPGATATFGELSLISLTYSREQGQYGFDDKGLTYRSFLSVDENRNKIVVESYALNAIKVLSSTLYDLYNNQQMGNFQDNIALTQYLEGQAAITNAHITQLAIFDQVTGINNEWLPGSVGFVASDAGNTEQTECRVWFSDVNFRNYDEYEILVIPPVDFPHGGTADDLNTSINFISNVVSANVTTDAIINTINQATQNARPTSQHVYALTWHDPNGSNFQYQTPWVFIGYGPDADSDPHIRQAIRDYLAQNSAFDNTVWSVIYPTVFEKMEFFVIPYWDQVAIGPVMSTVYSPAVKDITGMSDRAKQFSPLYAPVDVDASLSIVPILYKSLVALVSGNSTNKDGKIHLTDHYTDIALIPTADTDFDRMQPDTKDFILKLNGGLPYAEVMTETTQIGTGYNKQKINGLLYLIFTSNNTDIYVLSKNSLLDNL